jgi:hypothetical protein
MLAETVRQFSVENRYHPQTGNKQQDEGDNDGSCDKFLRHGDPPYTPKAGKETLRS